jgi:hypothetical protein
VVCARCKFQMLNSFDISLERKKILFNRRKF